MEEVLRRGLGDPFGFTGTVVDWEGDSTGVVGHSVTH